MGMLDHSRDTSMAMMKKLKNFWLELERDDRSGVVKDDRALQGEAMPVGIELVEVRVPVLLVVRVALAQVLPEEGVSRAGVTGSL